MFDGEYSAMTKEEKFYRIFAHYSHAFARIRTYSHTIRTLFAQVFAGIRKYSHEFAP